jgi:LytS/YehU family sensor histidine kinase
LFKNLVTYSTKQRWKFSLFLSAIIIGASSLLYTNQLVHSLSAEERKKVELWAEATKEIQNAGLAEDVSNVVYRILQEDKTIPKILVDEKENIISYANIDSARVNRTKGQYLKDLLTRMKLENKPIEISFSDGEKNYIYYKDSTLLDKLIYYPFIQLGVISLFIFVSYLAFSISRRMEQDQVWVGMSKETAHQLGTPISSLIAWVELLRLKNEDTTVIDEVSKDVERLQVITERFSKIGSPPVLSKTNLIDVLNKAVGYLKTRTSHKVVYTINFSNVHEIMVPINVPLFEWVIENICKNAIDAMNGAGNIDVLVKDDIQVVYIDIKDTGKGIAKSKYKTVFQPGYTTKRRGWGLGLSLSKRIIEVNHNGKIFVKNSELNKGTTFRIVLKK